MLFQIIAIIILLVFYGCYFAKMICQKRQGIQTDQIGKGKHGMVKAIEITMKFATIAVPVAEIISICSNSSGFPLGGRYVGVVLAVLGDGVFICAVLTMRDSWRAGVSESEKTELITDGIYQISRNPAFLGFDLVILSLIFHVVL